MRRLRRGHSRPFRGFQHAGRLHTQIRERAHARRASDNDGGAITATTLASAAGGGSCGGVTSADVHLGLAEADRGSLSAYGSDLLSSPLPSSARSGSSQDMAHSSDMGESCGLLPSPPQHRGGRRERHRAAGSTATGSAAGSATGSVSVASSSRRSASGGRTRGGEGEYSGQTLQSLGVKKAELMGWLARWEQDFEREHGSKPTHLQKASSQEYQRTHRELKRASQRLLLLGMSCGSLAEEGSKSSPGRCSRRSSAASPSGGDGAASSHSSCTSPDTVGSSGRRQCRV